MSRIVVFTSYGGGGHISASQAITEYLSDTYTIFVIPFFIEILAIMDPIRWISFNQYHVENVYNYALRRKWINFLNGLYFGAKKTLWIFKPLIKKLLYNYLNKTKPDFIISVIPLVNEIILEVAKDLEIPFLLIPTDLDLTSFLNGIDPANYSKFSMNIAFDDSLIWQKLNKTISTEQLKILGFPLRKSFNEPKNQEEIKKNFNINSSKPIILIMMGAVGSKTILSFIEQLITIEKPFHMIIVLGKNESMYHKIINTELPKHITATVLKFTDNIADLMAISDFCITKSGSVSVAECIYMNLPMLIDATSPVLLWEKFNHDFIKMRHFGDVINPHQIKELVHHYLANPDFIATYRHNLMQYPKKHFDKEIKDFIKANIIK